MQGHSMDRLMGKIALVTGGTAALARPSPRSSRNKAQRP
jgi:hypothetical protein